ncbi:putative aspartic peptidase A1 family [Helianthus annuus]|nr:putative aspartic peptidase A1 family [Helianthus annuus]
MGVNNGRGVVLVIIGFVVFASSSSSSSGNVVLEVHHKFAGRETTLKEVISHDANRHRRILSAADLPLGGDSRPTAAALVYALFLLFIWFLK